MMDISFNHLNHFQEIADAKIEEMVADDSETMMLYLERDFVQNANQ